MVGLSVPVGSRGRYRRRSGAGGGGCAGIILAPLVIGFWLTMAVLTLTITATTATTALIWRQWQRRQNRPPSGHNLQDD
jgi:membrane protein implicated in regulation of membrane protease activity